jgi:hypothetical protein
MTGAIAGYGLVGIARSTAFLLPQRGNIGGQGLQQSSEVINLR